MRSAIVTMAKKPIQSPSDDATWASHSRKNVRDPNRRVSDKSQNLDVGYDHYGQIYWSWGPALANLGGKPTPGVADRDLIEAGERLRTEVAEYLADLAHVASGDDAATGLAIDEAGNVVHNELATTPELVKNVQSRFHSIAH